MSALVSVLIPAYNAEASLSSTLEAVLAQTYDRLEVVVVDDGSTDRTPEILAAHHATGVRGLRQENAGAAAARNRAAAAASGEAVLFLDADDLIVPGHVEALVDRLGDSVSHLAMSEWGRFLHRPEDAVFPDRPGYTDADAVDWMVRDWSDARPMTQSGMFLIPRALLDRMGGWDERLSLIDDFEFFARLMAGSSGIRFAPGARLYYRSGQAASLSGQTGRRARESQALSLRLGTDHLLAAEDSPRTRRAAAAVLQDFVYDVYPDHPDLVEAIAQRVGELGGSALPPAGPPGFHRLRGVVGWRLARRLQRALGR